MARTGRKSQEMRHVSFRMPADLHQDYIAVAQSRGVDMSALLNWVLEEHRPGLLLRRAEHATAMLRAAAAGLRHSMPGLPEGAPGFPDLQEAIGKIKELSAQLREVALKLSEQAGGEEQRQAG
jgi:hypothetical protein